MAFVSLRTVAVFSSYQNANVVGGGATCINPRYVLIGSEDNSDEVDVVVEEEEAVKDEKEVVVEVDVDEFEKK